ncbi:hypothetical protein MXE48_06440 [Staphylococcus saprophyticus]|uniref:hypothetical protein n=1 Tax=Staphylococcus saprophyticus TaxID=29385 RepID=UPI00297A0901|nr:hypothetical protein [Staphylococcus saprophyticus]MDW3788473.1 hypothetical protein [Staphylococcus saprophyticus]MDW4034602.1 hypothetical protein [Staphylococcus saprophyticus]MDW4373023.1 hypothetical protein [Staphylococcus saprophyticus]MDW4413046.1 hypothetical protein [Staphylococcus saprophyticus]MEB5646765.1 hypothetical protein [Staphylococcus saprophyticus]
MKHILAWSTAILFTMLFALITFDFHYSLVISVISFIGSYVFWNSYYAEKKTAKRANA